jgi:hypothetical protein
MHEGDDEEKEILMLHVSDLNPVLKWFISLL